ncbi:pyridoxal phosphate-dependent aminotransferase [Hyunsoonleella aestuarii]|uniref:Aminotransferase n=1 Tax=Hyunsoonleella aestuarii TaxID=912802 RepID=A0ABP8E9S5_9FLAO|nr:aminotransferase class I/II-fold pyridoxal phosphate-dependent enzyme [Hyunsoonleella aestuarii]
MSSEKLNANVRNLKKSATLVINELSNNLITKGINVFKLGFGQSPFPVPKIVVDALKENAHQKDYLQVKGLPVLRKEIAFFYKRNYELSVSDADVIIGPGSKELIFNFQLVYNFKELLLPKPSWVSYEPQALLNNRKNAWLGTKEENDWKLTPTDIINYCEHSQNKIRVLILNYPSNPLGISYSSTELKALAVVLKQYNILVISDEIYGETHFKGYHQTLAKYYPEGTIISTGLSKWAGAGGWRLGVFIFPKKLRFILDAMAVVASETFTSTSAPIQYAAVEAYKQNESINTYLADTRKILKAVGMYTYNYLKDIGVSLPKPEGGFYVFPNFEKWKDTLAKRNILTNTQFCNTLLNETGVALLPGVAFGFPEEVFTARLSYVDFDGTLVLKILNKQPNATVDNLFVEKHCPRIVEALRKIEIWLSQE